MDICHMHGDKEKVLIGVIDGKVGKHIFPMLEVDEVREEIFGTVLYVDISMDFYGVEVFSRGDVFINIVVDLVNVLDMILGSGEKGLIVRWNRRGRRWLKDRRMVLRDGRGSVWSRGRRHLISLK